MYLRANAIQFERRTVLILHQSVKCLKTGPGYAFEIIMILDRMVQ